MTVLHLRVDLPEQAVADLGDAVDDEPGHYLFAHAVKSGGILQPFGSGMTLLQAVNLLRARGSLDVANGRTMRASDLEVVPLETPEKGAVELVVGERTRSEIERCAAFLRAFNRSAGVPDPPWTTPAEWVRELCLVEISRAATLADTEEIEREEAAAYPADKGAGKRAGAPP
jgi:hypothetical protein